MRVTLPYAAATRPGALPCTSLRHCQEEDRFPEFGTGSKFFNDFSRAPARKGVSILGELWVKGGHGGMSALHPLFSHSDQTADIAQGRLRAKMRHRRPFT